MKRFSYVIVGSLMFSSSAFAQQAQPSGTDGPPGQATGPASQMMRPHGPPPNVQRAIALLDQAKEKAGAETAALIEQAETLLKQPPPNRPHNTPGGVQGQTQQTPNGSAQGTGDTPPPPPQ